MLEGELSGLPQEQDIKTGKPSRGGAMRRLCESPYAKALRAALVGLSLYAPVSYAQEGCLNNPDQGFVDIVKSRLDEPIFKRIEEHREIDRDDQEAIYKIRDRFADDIIYGRVPVLDGDKSFGYGELFFLDCLDMGEGESGRCYMNIKINSPEQKRAKEMSIKWLKEHMGVSYKAIRDYPIVYSCTYEAGDCRGLEPFADDIISPPR